MRFVNRSSELARLDALVERGQDGLVAIWGRRRVGKTRLLLEWSRRHDGLYSVADLSSAPVQRAYLADALSLRFPGIGEAAYPDWRTLLRALAREATRTGWRGPLVLDELPYLVETSPSLPSVLQGWLDHEAKGARLLVAVSGSTQHMMQGLALGADSPLFGRTVAAMPIEPMTPRALGKALDLGDALGAVRAFAAWGGIPRYWELAEPFGADLPEALDELVLDPLAPLHLEPDRLLAEERPSAVSLRPLLDVIGAGAHRVSEIAGRIGQPATSLARSLARLTELGLVSRELPFGEPERGGKRSLYRIADPFFRLWFRVVAPHRALLAVATRETRRRLVRDHLPRLLSETWEDLCRRALPRLGSTAGRGGTSWGPARRYWRGSGSEWDVVALSDDGRRLLLGEVRWHDQAVSGDALERIHRELIAKGRPSVGSGREEVVRAVFVPRTKVKPGARLPFLVFDADAVVEAVG
jgi:AAA+ ATPase superfamily predicted ATPase